MPELPEVETVRAGLAARVLGRQIADVEILHDRAVRRHDGGARDLRARLRGAVLAAAVRRGKYLWLPLDRGSAARGGGGVAGDALTVHLGMSGQLLVHEEPAHAADSPHLRLRVAFDDGAELWFVDQRTFGHVLVAPLVPTSDGAPGGRGSAAAVLPAPIVHIARDVLDPVLARGTPARSALVDRVRSRRTGLKRVLLDQSLISGIGNIYADEGLHRAAEHYDRPAAALSRARWRAVLDAVAAVMTDALAAGGTSFDSLYVNVNGASGYFDRSLAVYGRAGESCPRCGTGIVRESFANRSSFRCPRCQPAPRPARSA